MSRPMSDDHVRAHLWIWGRVQGVFYRASTQGQARCLGLTGWVRNVPGGRVEAVLEGPREAVEQGIAWCRQGPAGARVSKLEVTWEEPAGDREFRITW